MWDMIAATVAPQILSGIMGSNAASDALGSQERAAAASDATQRYMYDTTRADALKQYEQARADNAPFLAAGTSGVNRLSRLLGLNGETGSSDYGSLTRKFGANDLANDTVYNSGLQFGLDEGTKGINNQAAASGNLLSGATLKALTRYGNDYATTKAGDAYNRYNNDNTNIYNRLAGITGTGQSALGQIGSAGSTMGSQLGSANANYGNNISNTALGLGNARAASGIAAGNAISGGISGAVNGYNQNQLMSRLFPNSGGGYKASWDTYQ
jgi:hypothetical protein